MSSIIKKLFGTLLEKPWEESQALIDNKHVGKTFGVTNQLSAVIIIFGISTAIFSLIFTAYLYSIPPEQDTTFILKNTTGTAAVSWQIGGVSKTPKTAGATGYTQTASGVDIVGVLCYEGDLYLNPLNGFA